MKELCLLALAPSLASVHLVLLYSQAQLPREVPPTVAGTLPKQSESRRSLTDAATNLFDLDYPSLEVPSFWMILGCIKVIIKPNQDKEEKKGRHRHSVGCFLTATMKGQYVHLNDHSSADQVYQVKTGERED